MNVIYEKSVRRSRMHWTSYGSEFRVTLSVVNNTILNRNTIEKEYKGGGV